MKNKIVEANICMVISKGFSGLNMNALKYLLPFWISPFTGVALRICCRCVLDYKFFCTVGTFYGKTKSSDFFIGSLGCVWIYVFVFGRVE